MNRRIFTLLLTLLLSSHLLAQDKYILEKDFNGLTFKEFVSSVEGLLDVRFYYKDEWVSDLKVEDYTGSRTLSGYLDYLFRGKYIYYIIDESGNVILTSNYVIKVSDEQIIDDDKFIPPTEYSDSQDYEKMSENIFMDIGNPADRNMPGNVTVSGYITNKDTKDPVPGVTVFIQELAIGAISNAYGYYTLTLPRGIHLVKFSFIGMRERMINLNLYGEGEMDVEMNSVLIPLKETIVSAQKSTTLQRFEVGAEKINITSFKLLPTSLGESDIIKSVLLIPGVQSVGEGSAGFNVRGGTADQNLILLYGAPVYNSSHFFGFFSAVNSNIIKNVTLYKGGIPSRYGGRISSVLDIESNDGSRKEFAGNAGISPITTHLTVEGPLIKDTCTFLLSGRTTYSNWVLGLIDNPALQKSRASFHDLNGRITYDLNRNNKFDVSSYYSHDAFQFNSDSIYSYNNNIFVFRWRHFFNSRFFSSLSINNSSYNYNVSSESVASEAFVLSHKLNSTGFKADFNWFQGRNEVNFGLDINNYQILPGKYFPASDSSLVIPKYIDREKAWEGALYIDDKFILNSILSIDIGMRVSSFFSYGPQDIMIYDPEYAKGRSTITDTLNYRSGEIAAKYAGPELRVSLNFRLSDKNSFKINYSRTRQYLHLLSNSTSIAPTDTWKLSDYYVKPQIGDQFALGFYKMLFRGSYETSAEIYYKQIKNMVDFKGGTSLVMNDNIEKDLVNVKGKAYGLELIFKKTMGKVRYSIGYTYARTFLKSIGSFSEEIINSGNWFPANFDKPNDLVVTFNYLLSRRFSFSSNYTWSTGRPITFPVTTYNISDKLMIHYSDRNKYRIPDYSRLDISFKVSGNLKSRKIAYPNWTFSVYNLLGRQNVYSIYFTNENEILKGYKLSVFGKAIPSVTFSFDF